MATREQYLEWHRKYNASAKGQARNKKYEKAHPERADRLRTGMIARDRREENGNG